MVPSDWPHSLGLSRYNPKQQAYIVMYTSQVTSHFVELGCTSLFGYVKYNHRAVDTIEEFPYLINLFFVQLFLIFAKKLKSKTRYILWYKNYNFFDKHWIFYAFLSGNIFD